MATHSCIFCKIISGDIPAHIIWQNDSIIAINDIAPKADTHILVIPKKHIQDIVCLDNADAELAADLLLATRDIAKKYSLDAFRLVVNNGKQAGQSVFHLHIHILAGMHIPGMQATDL